MLKILSIFLCLCSINLTQASEALDGDWQGELMVSKRLTLPLVFHLNTLNTDTASASIDSPKQRAYGIPASQVKVEGNTIFLDLAAIGATFQGAVQHSVLQGTFSQMGREFALEMQRLNEEQLQEYKDDQRRPQEPTAPFPYEVEKVTFKHPVEAFELAGTLTKPHGVGPFPAVLLISGSGPQDRDETLFGHKPFLIIADHLTQQGYAVLRVDDRGVGQSQGVFGDTTLEEFTTDIAAAIQYLASRADINQSAIGLAGHSEGAMTGAMYISQHKQLREQPDAAFLIMLAGVGVTGKQLWLDQQFAAVQNLPDEIRGEVQQALAKAVSLAQQGGTEAELKVHLRKAGVSEAQTALNAQFLPSRWGRSFLQFDPHQVLARVDVPVLVLHGSLDKQVDMTSNLQGLKTAFDRANNNRVVFKELKGVNHLLQPARTGMPDEYASIDETVSQKVLDSLSRWLSEQPVTKVAELNAYSE